MHRLARVCATLATCAMMAAAASEARATHLNLVGPIDAIDGVFPSGGGTFNGFVAINETAWYAFGANAGDNVQINVNVFGEDDDPVVGLFRAVQNGIVEVGDDPMCADTMGVPNCGGQGVGHDLEWLAFDDDGGAGFNSQIALTLAASGEYAIAVQSFNREADIEFEVILSGNTADIEVPEPMSLALFGLGLAGLGLARRRRVA